MSLHVNLPYGGTMEGISRRDVLKGAGTTALGGGLIGTATASNRTLRQQLAEVRRATQKYRDPSVAVADGYEPGDYWCGGGDHYVDLTRRHDGELDRLEPAVITYGRTGTGDLVLAGVEYQIVQADREEDVSVTPNLFDDEGADLKLPEEAGWEFFEFYPGGIWSLHVWVHVPNPNGLFNRCHPGPMFYREGCKEHCDPPR